MKKILLVTGDGGESYETLYAIHRLQEAGHKPVVAAPSKRRLHLVLHDFEPGWDTFVEKVGYGADADILISKAKAKDYDAVLLLGGRAPEYLRHDKKCLALVREFHRQGKWLFAICHGVQILVAAGLVDGATMTCYENIRFELESGGGRYHSAQAVRHKQFVTAQTWQSHPEFYREVFRALGEG